MRGLPFSPPSAFSCSGLRQKLATVCGLTALAGAFHVAVDRALGYGLKRPDAFTHTHLGWIGRDRPRA
ncbi:MAG: DUF4260 family protein [Microcella pacifica]